VDEESRATEIPPRPSAASAREEWEEALADDAVNAGTWSGIGQHLFAAGLYRESIAAFERSYVHCNGRSPEDARSIAEAYAKLGNVKQAMRWRAMARGAESPSRRHVGLAV
jgi:hypothetical protein